jgi:seryl-tRNA synthetase
MIDIRLLREDFDATAAALARRGVDRAALERIRELDRRRRELITRGDELRSQQKDLSRQVGAAGGEEKQQLIEQTRAVSAELKELEPAQADAERRLDEALAVIPNLPHHDAPEGVDEHDAVELERFGERPAFDFSPRDHHDLGEALGVIDVPRAAKVSGSRFAYLLGSAVMLQLGLVRYTVDILTAEGFVPVVPPVLTREEALHGTGFLPTGAEQIYAVEKDDLYLVGTSEVPLGAFHMDEILAGDDLPIRYAGISTCFRREAGTYGKDTRGIFRVHQFDKVEMFAFTRPEDSEAEHERLKHIQTRVLAGLDLHGRIVDIPVGDLGASASRKYDIEVWLAGQDDYRELTSASNCTDYQARRLRCRYRTADGGTAAVHTLNGTACAVGRTIIALLETHQRADGSVAVPPALQPYVGAERIG